MERTFKHVKENTEKNIALIIHDATESMLANLPILILGAVIGLAIAGELFL